MNTPRTILQTIALSALLGAQMHGALIMPGVRQALRMIDMPVVRMLPAPLVQQMGADKDSEGPTVLGP